MVTSSPIFNLVKSAISLEIRKPWLVPHLNRPKIYGSRFTLALVENKLKEHNLNDQVHLVTVEPGDQIDLAGITFHFFPVSHSIIQGFALGMETPAGRMLHSGDFKIDPAAGVPGWSTDLESLRQFAAPGLKLLMAARTGDCHPVLQQPATHSKRL